MTRRFLFLVASARREGNTETLARVAASKLPDEVQQQWIHLDEFPLPRFEDIRHHGGRNNHYPEPEGNERLLLDATLNATDIVIVAPVYWYSLPASAKLYMDYWSAWLRVPGADFKQRMAGKKLYAICVQADDDPKRAELLLNTLRYSAEYMNMEWGGELLGNGSKPGDVLNDRSAVQAAERFFTSQLAPRR
ncbi:MAG TPA: NAD(P)H-dependent oxidoreductase [Candidatus Koribacter sp.]|jgi:multimeric flavodoxin WrbA